MAKVSMVNRQIKREREIEIRIEKLWQKFQW